MHLKFQYLFDVFFHGRGKYSSPIGFPMFFTIYDLLYELNPPSLRLWAFFFQQLWMSIVTYMLLCLEYEVKYSWGMLGCRLQPSIWAVVYPDLGARGLREAENASNLLSGHHTWALTPLTKRLRYPASVRPHRGHTNLPFVGGTLDENSPWQAHQ